MTTIDTDERVIVRAQKRILGLYREMGKPGGWRGVARYLAQRVGLHVLNVAYVYEFVSLGRVPANVDIRRALFLPKMLPSERKDKLIKTVVHVGQGDWERLYFRMQLKRGRPSKKVTR